MSLFPGLVDGDIISPPPPRPPPFVPRIVQPREPGVLSVSAGMRKCCNASLSLSSLAGGLVPAKGSC